MTNFFLSADLPTDRVPIPPALGSCPRLAEISRRLHTMLPKEEEAELLRVNRSHRAGSLPGGLILPPHHQGKRTICIMVGDHSKGRLRS